MKTKEEILKAAYSKIENRQLADEQVDVIILEAMESYASQFTPEWISVSERLPGNDKLVLIIVYRAHANKRMVRVGFYETIPHSRWWQSVGEKDVTDEVTHWMPLPQPPITKSK